MGRRNRTELSPASGANLATEISDGSLGAPTPVGPTIQTIRITVQGRQASGDTGRVTVSLGAPATLPVTSDVADEIQVRGYDRKVKVPADGTVSVSFTTSASGVFDVELRQSRFGAAAG